MVCNARLRFLDYEIATDQNPSDRVCNGPSVAQVTRRQPRRRGRCLTLLFEVREQPVDLAAHGRLTSGHGADCVVEVGGAGTLQRSYNALARGGKVGLIGVLTQGVSNPHSLMMKGGNLHGIFVGGRDLFEQMNAAINANGIKPVIDKVFPFDQAKDAFGHVASGDFIGKVIIAI